MRLIDADVLKADYGMADDCKDCKTGYRSCEYDRIYSKMDFCGWLDDAPTVDAVPLGVEMWEDRFNIQTRTWRTKDGETEATSFIITRREQKDGDHDRG